jgi:type II secretory pathway pseudopilin PulG
MAKIYRHNAGFTITEVLIVAIIIVLLATITFSMVKSTKRQRNARNIARQSDVNAILNAMSVYQADQNGDLSGLDLNNDGLYYLIGTGGVGGCSVSACRGGFTPEIDCFDLSASPLQNYLSKIPVDPLGNKGVIASWSSSNTGYVVKSESNGKITVLACEPEDPQGGTDYPTIQAFFNFTKKATASDCPYELTIEVCDDSIDNDCDGETDEAGCIPCAAKDIVVWNNGSATLKWSDSGNWHKNRVPTESSCAVFTDDTSSDISIVDSDFSTTVDTLVLSDYSGAITLETNLTVEKYYQYSGIFNETRPFNGASVDQNIYALTINQTGSKTGGVFHGSDKAGFNADNTEAKRIANAAELQGMNADLTENYVQYGDIDVSSIANFDPIGKFENKFYGIFLGNNYTILNLSINRPADGYVGLFGNAGSKLISNVRLLDVNIVGLSRVGSIAGNFSGNDDHTLKNSYATGIVEAKGGDPYPANPNVGDCDCAGGLLGRSDGISIINSYSESDVTGGGHDVVGGLVGFFRSDKNIVNSYATGNVNGGGGSKVGGLIGYFNEAADSGSIIDSYSESQVIGGSGHDIGGLVGTSNGPIINSYATGNVSANGGWGAIGGLVGYNYDDITNSYATGNVNGGDVEYVGGLVGYNTTNSTISDSYSQGDVIGSGSKIGGFAGFNNIDGTITNSYSAGDVAGSGTSVGGLIGSNYGTIEKSYSSGRSSGSEKIGGLVGYFAYGSIINSYAIGDVSSTGASAGGLVGYISFPESSSVDITNSYSIGSVAGSSNVGGFLGWINGASYTFTANFWNSDNNPTLLDVGGGDVDGVMGKTTIDMTKQATFSPPWNFSNPWTIVDNTSYPCHKWWVDGGGSCPVPGGLICTNTSEADWFVSGEGDCNQCDHSGDDDSDQANWSAAVADQCDSDCGTVASTVMQEDYEGGVEISCSDSIDNDCDGNIDGADSDCGG